jgi:DNA-binding NarL/FixJ family response regulator
MLQVGAKGYVTKNSSKEEMFTAITEVFKGNKYVCDEIKTIISDQLLDENQDVPSINSLTEREIQIINHIREGLSSKEIANRLEISLKTVEVHRHNVLKKLKLKNSASLVNFINSNAGYV